VVNTYIAFFKEHGIHKQFTTRYTPQQNGVAKRKNRKNMELARIILKAMHFPNDYLAEYAACTTYIINRCQNKSVRNITLEEVSSGRKHSVIHMRVFGCVAYTHVPDELRKKLDRKGGNAYFLAIVMNRRHISSIIQ